MSEFDSSITPGQWQKLGQLKKRVKSGAISEQNGLTPAGKKWLDEEYSPYQPKDPELFEQIEKYLSIPPYSDIDFDPHIPSDSELKLYGEILSDLAYKVRLQLKSDPQAQKFKDHGRKVWEKEINKTHGSIKLTTYQSNDDKNGVLSCEVVPPAQKNPDGTINSVIINQFVIKPDGSFVLKRIINDLSRFSGKGEEQIYRSGAKNQDTPMVVEYMSKLMIRYLSANH